MNAWLVTLNHWAGAWETAVVRASWQGGLALALAWAAGRWIPGLPARARCWLFRLAYAKLLFALVWVTPIELRWLPSSVANVSRPSVATIPAAPLTMEHTEPDPANALAETPRIHPAPLSLGAWLLLAWTVGAGAGLYGLVRVGGQARRLRADARPVTDEPALDACAAMCRRLRVRRAPKLLTVDAASGPLLTGMFRPAIILPGRLLDAGGSERLGMVLAHELAHLKRRDLLWAWLPAVADALFFFHPLVWAAGREWQLAHEIACDESAVRASQATLSRYAGLLLETAAGQVQLAPLSGVMAIGILENKKTLKRRINAMKSIPQNSRRRLALCATAIALIGGAGLLPWRLVAQDSETETVAQLREENARLRAQLNEARERFGVEYRERREASESRSERSPLIRSDETVAKDKPATASSKESKTEFSRGPEPTPATESLRNAVGRNAKMQARLKELSREEIRLSEQQLAELNARVAAGQASGAEVVDARRELLNARRALAESEGDYRATVELIQGQIKLVGEQLDQVKRQVEAGTAPNAAVIAVRKELLRLQREQLLTEMKAEKHIALRLDGVLRADESAPAK